MFDHAILRLIYDIIIIKMLEGSIQHPSSVVSKSFIILFNVELGRHPGDK